MKSIMSMSQCIAIACAVAKMKKPEVFCQETGYHLEIIAEDDTWLKVLVIFIDSGESHEYEFKRKDRENYQFLFASKGQLALLVVDKE